MWMDGRLLCRMGAYTSAGYNVKIPNQNIDQIIAFLLNYFILKI